jgi:hypothetical protein
LARRHWRNWAQKRFCRHKIGGRKDADIIIEFAVCRS